jgi:hypothetical protein
MRQKLLLLLLLATVVALADDRPKAQHAAGAAEAQAKTEAAQAGTGHAQAQTQEAQRRSEKVPAKTEAAQARAEHAQAQTEKAQNQTEEAQGKTEGDAKLVSVPEGKALGMSVLGNQEAPKSLVIVPWKTSELGRSPGVSPMLDDSRQPVDKEVFMRALRYYEIRSGTKP